MINYGCPRCKNERMLVPGKFTAIGYFSKINENDSIDSDYIDAVDHDYNENNIHCDNCDWSGTSDDLISLQEGE